jgi:2-dehydro-3-deoxyphosphogluconate aldolase / (4S)-4-hydroxy-2-oxoglutarate aldolase
MAVASEAFSARVRQTIDTIGDVRVIAVLRAPDASRLAAAADILVSHGVRAVEFALTTEGALEALERYRSSMEPSGVSSGSPGSPGTSGSEPAGACVGAGTVLTAAQARSAVNAGARYLVTPAFVPEVIEAGAELAVPVVSGAFTPTEILAAYNAGAPLVKVFPAALGGPSYLRLVRDPLPHIPLVPTGGISIDQAADYLAAGAFAVGMGGQLLGDSLRGGDLNELAMRAKRLVAAISAGTSR